jgi:tetratricopeptide (TPR) repeat protein
MSCWHRLDSPSMLAGHCGRICAVSASSKWAGYVHCCRAFLQLVGLAGFSGPSPTAFAIRHEIPVLFSHIVALPRRMGGRASLAARAVVFTFRLVIVLLAASTSGCATFGRRSPAPAEIAACRELCVEGVAAIERGNWQQAEVLLQQAVEMSPNDAESRQYLAEVLWRRGAADQAMSQMAAAVELDPADAELAVRAGEMSLAINALDTALSHADAAIRLDPKQASAWALRGRVFRCLKQNDRAMADWQRALELAPNDANVLLDVALLYRERGQSARALAALHHLLDVYPPGEEPQAALMLEGLALMDLQRPYQAVDSLLAAARRGPPNAEVLYRLAQAQWSTGRYAEATSSAEQALAIDGSHQASRQLLLQMANLESPDSGLR